MCKRPVCTRCRETDGLRWDAWAGWHDGKIELISTYDDVWCENCEAPATVEWTEEPADAEAD